MAARVHESRAPARLRHGQRGRRFRLLGIGCGRAEFPTSTCRCAVRCPSRGGCRTRWPSWSRSTHRASAWACTSMTSTRRSSHAALDAVVEGASTAVGVDLNTASPPLLAYVSGRRQRLAAASSRTATRNGAFRRPRALLEVAGPGRPRRSSRRRASCASGRRQPARSLGRAPRDLLGGRADPPPTGGRSAS